MKVFVQLDARDGATIQDFQTPAGVAEEKLVWKYFSEGYLREMNFQTIRIGVVFIFEAESVSHVQEMIEALPFVKSGLLKTANIQQLAPFVGLAALFDPVHLISA